jgi:large subunit ribosomal protein L18
MKELRIKRSRLARRKNRSKAVLTGTTKSPRMLVTRTNQYITVQLIDDTKGATLLGMSSKSVAKGTINKDSAFKLGQEVAKAALAKDIHRVVFDRGGRKYHGRIAAFAEGARKEGLKF